VGGPLWTLTLPILAVVLTLWLLLPLPGRHGIGVALAAGVFGFSLAAIIAMTGSGVHSISVVTLISMLGALLLPILTLVLAIAGYWRRATARFGDGARELGLLRAYPSPARATAVWRTPSLAHHRATWNRQFAHCQGRL
jgi:hypothetical protein